jgi:hypothetical protein
MVDLPVIKAFTHDGRALRVGDTITVSPLVAAALHRRGLVSLTRGYKTAAIKAEPVVPSATSETAAEPYQRRRYRRRDMTAESE